MAASPIIALSSVPLPHLSHLHCHRFHFNFQILALLLFSGTTTARRRGIQEWHWFPRNSKESLRQGFIVASSRDHKKEGLLLRIQMGLRWFTPPVPARSPDFVSVGVSQYWADLVIIKVCLTMHVEALELLRLVLEYVWQLLSTYSSAILQWTLPRSAILAKPRFQGLAW